MAQTQDILRIKHNVSANILTFRRWLTLTQRDFIDTYLIGKTGEPLVSVSALSGIENGTQGNPLPLAKSISEKLDVDANIFEMEPDSFAKNVDFFFNACVSKIEQNSSSRNVNAVGSLVQELSDYLMDGMINGELKPGDKLPSDRSLSTAYGVGRSSIREALKVLSALGLINILPGNGTFIASRHTDFFLAPLSWSLFVGQHDTAHLLEMRSIIEAETARMAAQRADKESKEKLASIYEQMQVAYQSENFQAFLDSDLDFHLAIANCSGNPVLYRLLQTSRRILTSISKGGMGKISYLDEIAAEHAAIYEAIIAGNAPDAQKHMQTHLDRARNRYRV